MTSKSRDLDLDASRGIAIFLVVLAHTWRGLESSNMLQPSPYLQIADYAIYSCHMAAFFLLAGLTTQQSLRRGRIPFLQSKLRTVAYPYIVWSLLQGGLMVALSSVTNEAISIQDLASILWRPIAQFWFLHTLFALQLLTAVLVSRYIMAGLSIVAFAFAGLYGGEWIGVDILHFMIFYSAGMLCSERIFPFAARCALPGLLIAFAVLLLFATRLSIPYMSAEAFPLAVVGILTILKGGTLCASSRWGQWLVPLGAMSMSIYVMQIIAASGIRIILHKSGVPPIGLLYLIVCTAGGLLLPVAAHQLMEKYDALWLFGLGRRKRT